jgi:hypothetical protein
MGELTSALDEGEWSASSPGSFIPGERASGTYWIGGWVGHRVGLHAVEKRKISCPCRESNRDSSTVRPVARRYTNSRILVLILQTCVLKVVITFFVKAIT